MKLDGHGVVDGAYASPIGLGGEVAACTREGDKDRRVERAMRALLRRSIMIGSFSLASYN